MVSAHDLRETTSPALSRGLVERCDSHQDSGANAGDAKKAMINGL